MIWLTASMVSCAVAILLLLVLFILIVGLWWFLPEDASTFTDLWQGFTEKLQAFLFARPGDGLGLLGVFPAFVGTSVLVLLMTVLVAPLGVMTAVFLQEYARDNAYTRLVRIAIHNLAGVPSVVYGVFGLGFFIYGVGGGLDALLFQDALPKPTMGTPGLLWAALTLALLTLPIVIVTAEEGLARIPRELRESSIALGATQFETLTSVVLPAASPSIMTGIILAVARAAGEVAPLMLVGVVKYAPSLPIDARVPFIHLEQKFMHLGFHLYDAALFGSTGDGRLGLVCATAVLLVGLVVCLNLVAVVLRQRLRDRYQQGGEW